MRSRLKAQASTPRRNSRTLTLIAGGAIGLVFLAMVLVRIGLNNEPTASAPVPAPMLDRVTGVPAAILNHVGQGGVQALPIKVSGGPPLVAADGRPRVVYIGAEFCPFCASQRWAMVVALSRFGRFNGLTTSHSATDDVFPNTQTFTFRGSNYISDYIAFEPVETRSNVKVDGVYAPLEVLTPDQEALMTRFSNGSIPFMDIANLFIVSGASFSPSVLAGKSHNEIAERLANPNDDSTRAILGTANILTAALCVATESKPAEACNQPAVAEIQAKLSQ